MKLYRSQSSPAAPLPEQAPNTVQAMAPATVVAAWPAGVSQLAIAAEVCQRSDYLAVRSDWMASTLA